MTWVAGPPWTATPRARAQAAGPDASAAGPGASQAEQAQAKRLFERGLAAYAEGKLEVALGLLQQAQVLHPSAELLYNLARVHERMGNAQQGIALYRQYLREGSPTPAEREAIHARLQALRELDARQKAPLIKRPAAAGELASEARAFFERGRKLYARGKYSAAHAAFAAARQLSPMPELSYNLGLTCERLARTADAVDHYRAYLRARPEAADADDVRARIKRLQAQR